MSNVLNLQKEEMIYMTDEVIQKPDQKECIMYLNNISSLVYVTLVYTQKSCSDSKKDKSWWNFALFLVLQKREGTEGQGEWQIVICILEDW